MVVDRIKRMASVKQTSQELGIPIWKLRRAAKNGHIPSYTLFNDGIMLCPEEVIACLQLRKTEVTR